MRIYGVILTALLLVACDSSGNSNSNSNSINNTAAGAVMPDENAEAAAEYQKKMSSKVADSMVNSFVRDWDISEDEARCVVDNIGTAELMRAESDPDVQAQLIECGVDPAVIN